MWYKLIVALVEARDEFPELDLVFPWSAPHLIMRSDHYTVRPFYIRHNDEEIRVTVKKIDTHFKREYPFYMNF